MDIKLSDRLDMKFDIQVSNANKNSGRRVLPVEVPHPQLYGQR